MLVAIFRFAFSLLLLCLSYSAMIGQEMEGPVKFTKAHSVHHNELSKLYGRYLRRDRDHIIQGSQAVSAPNQVAKTVSKQCYIFRFNDLNFE